MHLQYTDLISLSVPQKAIRHLHYRLLSHYSAKEMDDNLTIQSGEIKSNPEMDESAVWAGKGCMAVFPFTGYV